MSAPNDSLRQLVPVPRPHCHQIMGIVGKVSWRRYIRNWTFQYYYLFLVEALRTENVSFPKPVGFALWLVGRNHRPVSFPKAVGFPFLLLGHRPPPLILP